MHVLYHHRTAGDRVERVHIMGMVDALWELGHTVEISSPPGCDPQRTDHGPDGGSRGWSGALRSLLKRLARKAPSVLFEVLEIAYNAYSFWDMSRRARERKPDLIYERTTANSVAPTYLARRWGVPIVQEVNVTTEIGRLRPLVLRDLTQRLEQWMIRNSEAFITVSREFRRMMTRDGFPAERVYVCQNAIDPADFNPETVEPAVRPVGLNAEAPVVGYVGAFVPYHRLDMLVECARSMRDDHDVVWLLVGDGVDRPRIEDLIDDFGLHDAFWLPGRVPHERVPKYVKAMDVAVLPSSETFNSPMKLFEYMGMGRAVVAPRTPAIAEVIEPGQNGFLFEPGEGASFESTVRALVEDAEMRRGVGRRAREYVLENRTWQANAEKLLRIVAEVEGREPRYQAGDDAG